MITVSKFDEWARSVLPFSRFTGDVSLNGLQVGNPKAEVSRVAFALDACLASFEEAAKLKADLLFVHHGLFWGKSGPVADVLYRRLEVLMTAKINLYATHLPLDAATNCGNNAALAQKANLQHVKNFGELGYMGDLTRSMSAEELSTQVFGDESGRAIVWPFGVKSIRTVAIVSGGASKLVDDAVAAGVDCFITGEATHDIYHYCEEARLTVIAGGHYASEYVGLKRFREEVDKTFPDLKTFMIDIPTGV